MSGEVMIYLAMTRPMLHRLGATRMDPRLGMPCTASYILAVLENTRNLPPYTIARAAHSGADGAIAIAGYLSDDTAPTSIPVVCATVMRAR